jgi:ketosteroid isomerase-like protein
MAETLESEIGRAEEARYRAMIDRDFAALEAILADDLLYTHSSAVTDTKQSYLESLRSGKVRYFDVKRDGVVVRGYGDVAVVHGHGAIQAEVDGEPRALDNIFVNVWVRRDGRWQMVHWASTAIPKR